MTYLFFASLALGGLSTLYLLWRKSQVEGDLKQTKGDLLAATNEAKGWKISYDLLKKDSDDKLSRLNAQVTKLETQNAEYLEALKKSSAPGVFAELLQKRNASGVSNPA